jgi:hypothetical protein
MIQMIKFLKITTILLTLSIQLTYSQIFYDESDVDENYDPKQDMIIQEIQEFKLKFFKGDTIRYRVSSHDSIIVDYDAAIVKTRFELYEIICDSVSKNGRFHLRMRLKSYIADEKKGKMAPVRRETHTWVGREVFLTIDSLGRRYRVGIDDSTLYSMSPGGAFQPSLFVPFGDTYKFINESWSINSLDTLVENGCPFPLARQAFLFRAERPIDTLDHESVRFRFIRTAQGAVTVISEDTKIRIDAVLNGAGNMIISSADFLPVHHFANIEQKMKLKYPDDTELPIWHFNSTDFVIDDIKPGPGRLTFREQNKKAKEELDKKVNK